MRYRGDPPPETTRILLPKNTARGNTGSINSTCSWKNSTIVGRREPGWGGKLDAAPGNNLYSGRGVGFGCYPGNLCQRSCIVSFFFGRATSNPSFVKSSVPYAAELLSATCATVQPQSGLTYVHRCFEEITGPRSLARRQL